MFRGRDAFHGEERNVLEKKDVQSIAHFECLSYI